MRNISGNTITITFRAKLDDFAGGPGYKVPTLTHSHVKVSSRDTFGTILLQGLGNGDVTLARLAKFAGLQVPGVVFVDSPGEWTITPVGNGFMAKVSITRQILR